MVHLQVQKNKTGQVNNKLGHPTEAEESSTYLLHN